MTEGARIRHDKPMCIRIWLEVGHTCEPRRSPSGRALSLDWRIWVRGASGHDISAFVHKVVFNLHPPSEFVYPKRVIQEPPFEIQESGCASIEIPIHVYMKYSIKPKKIKLRYSLHIENNTQSSSESSCVYYDFENPSKQLRRALMQGGGEIIASTKHSTSGDGKLLVVLSDNDVQLHNEYNVKSSKKYKFVQPISYKEVPKKRSKNFDESCQKCGKAGNVDFKKLLNGVSMSDSEINLVSQLYLSYSNYEKSGDSLELPPLSDPIYGLPELPPSLRGCLSSVEADYATQ